MPAPCTVDPAAGRPSGRASRSRRPPWAAAIAATIDSPSPEPVSEPVRSAPSRWNGRASRSTCAWSSTGPPVSTTSRTSSPAGRRRSGSSRRRCCAHGVVEEVVHHPGQQRRIARDDQARCRHRWSGSAARTGRDRAAARVTRSDRSTWPAGRRRAAARARVRKPSSRWSTRSSWVRSRSASTTVCAGRVRLGRRHVQRRPHGRQRGAQLVRGVRDEPALRGERRLEPLQQAVDGVGEVLDLVGRAG